MKISQARILFLHSSNNSAIGYYRSRVPARALAAAGHEVTWREEHSWFTWMKPSPERWLLNRIGEFDFVISDRECLWDSLAMLAEFRNRSPQCRLIADFDDDFLDVPRWNTANKRYRAGHQFRQVSLAHLRLAEMTTVSTLVLAEQFAPRCHALRVAPNVIDPADWADLPTDPERSTDPCLRILYGGAAGHFTDLDAVRPGLEAVLRNPPVPLRFICFGALPLWLHQVERDIPGRVVNLPWVDLFESGTRFPAYPQAVAWGGFDLAIAPLTAHPFNESKSNIKALEAGIQRIPLVCSKIGPYADLPDGTALRLDNTPQDWEAGLRAILSDPSLRESLRDEAHTWVRDTGTIDKAAQTWQSVLEDTAARPRILTLEDAGLTPPPDLPEESPEGASQADSPALERPCA